MAIISAAAIPVHAQEIAATLNKPATEILTAPPDESEKKPALVITGSADMYYRYGFEKGHLNNKTSFTNTHNAFTLGMVSVKFEHTGARTSVVADLGFGSRAKEFSYNETGLLSAVKQLYITYNATDWLKFTAGTWATHVGYELVDPQLNRNYSMSYMFTNGPFTHTGVKAEVSRGKHGFMLGVSNAADFRIQPDGYINKKFVIAQYSLAISQGVKLYLNYVGGQAPDTAKVRQTDLVLTTALTPRLSLGLNATDKKVLAWDGGSKTNVSGAGWRGVALYLNYDCKKGPGLTLRSEYFNNKKSGLTDGNGLPFKTSLFANTLSANLKADGFIFVPEIRFENAATPIFAGKNGIVDKKAAASVLLAVIYHF